MSIVDETAGRLLRVSPDPVPKLRILRDLLDMPEDSRDVLKARADINSSRWFVALSSEQLEHGGWARFHSMDSTSRNSIATTEFGVQRALEIGLTREDPLLQKTVHYLVRLLDRDLPFSELEENNDRWTTGRDMFVASTLAMIDGRHARIREIASTWIEIARRTFDSGDYRADDELAAHCELTGARTMRDSYLVISNKYALTILGCAQERLPDKIERPLVEWLWSLPGIRYVDVPPGLDPAALDHRRATGWLTTQFLLSRFRTWSVLSKPSMEGLLVRRDDDGLWDFGATTGLRLSERWRRPDNRRIDHTVFVLLLLKAAGL